MEQVRERTLEVLDEVDLDPDDAAARATASSTRCCSPTSTSTTRRCCSCCRWSSPTSRSRRDRGPGLRAGRRRARDGRRSTAARTRSAPRPDGFAYDNERPRHDGRARGLRDRPHPRHQRRLRRVPRGDRRRAADVLGARRRGRLGRARRWARTEPVDPGACPSSMSPGTRPTRSPAGRASGCRPSTSGRPPPPAPTRDRANLDQLAFGSRPGRRLRRRRLRLRRRADARRRLGVDLERLHRPTRASRPSRTRSTRRSSSATPTRCCAAAPGPPAAT